jgi:hypothetical protein
MKVSRRGVIRVLVSAVLGLTIAGIAAPFIRADRYGQQIREAMERGLNRKVEIGNVTFNLFNGPGFSIQNVIIYDDPSAGIEPFAHMDELNAAVRLSALMAGRIEFARLRFVEPSVNIVKPVNGPWNVVPLLQRTVSVNASANVARLPELQVVDGRINFKFGDRKSAFYFTRADVVVAPRSSEKGAFLVQFSGEPSRTDRAAQGFGEFTAAGRLLTEGPESRLEIDMGLEKGDLADLVTLFRGQSVGLHGLIATNAKIYGPLSKLQLLGTVSIDDVHRWDVAPDRTGGIALKYRGSYDASSGRLDLAASHQDNPGVPLSARLVVEDLLSKPQWSADLSVDGMPASSLIQVARDMGAPIPNEVSVRGNVVGVVGYGSVAGLQGELAIDKATVKLGGGPELTVEHAGVLVDGEEMRLTRAFVGGEGRSADLEAIFVPTKQQFGATIRGRGLPIASLASGSLIATTASPLVSRLSGGTWSGWVRYTSDSDRGAWTANLDVRDTSTRVPGMSLPVKIASASVELDDADVRVRRMRFSVGAVEVSGDYGYAAKGNLHTFGARIAKASGEELERILMPTIERSPGLLARMRWRSSLTPEWLRLRNANGVLRIDEFSLGEHVVRHFQSGIKWSGAVVKLTEMEGRFQGGVLAADALLDLSKPEPAYRVNGSLTGLSWRGGRADLSGEMTTNGTGEDVLLNLRSEGTFQARSIDVIPEYPLNTISGTYTFGIARTGPQVKLTALQAASGSERFLGEGSTQPDGRLQLELASASRVMQVTGKMIPLRLEVATERAAGDTR